MEKEKTILLKDLMGHLKKKMEECGAEKEANRGKLSPEKQEIADFLLDLYLFFGKKANSDN